MEESRSQERGNPKRHLVSPVSFGPWGVILDIHPTRDLTLRRLSGLAGIDNVLDVIDLDAIAEADEWGWELYEIAGQQAAWFWAQNRSREAEWCHHASLTLGVPVSVKTQGCGGLLVIDVDDQCYGIGYGQGFRWIKDECVDQRFGLGVAVRAVDPEHLRSLIRRRPAMRGRTESSLVPAGAPIWWLKPQNYTEIVRRIAGKGRGIEVTYARQGRRQIVLEGSSGLKMRLGVSAVDLVQDLRTVASVAARELPDPELAFVDNIIPISEKILTNELDKRLETALEDDAAIRTDELALALPDAGLDYMPSMVGYRIALGAREIQDDVTIEDLAQLARRSVHGKRLAALARLQLEMHGARDGSDLLWKSKAIKWLEFCTTIDDKNYFMMETKWYQIASEYLSQVKALVSGTISQHPSVDLPAWPKEFAEEDYNKHVASLNSSFVCLDRKLVKDGFHTGPGLEICDLLGPNNELIHVKKADGSSSLSHLFAQGLVSVDSLGASSKVRQGFRERVAQYGRGRIIEDDFRPKRVVFAILLPKGRTLQTDSLFPFSQATLAQTAGTLQDRGIHVEAFGISLTE
jgi:uncharacterized protein (TIGR04141 family)